MGMYYSCMEGSIKISKDSVDALEQKIGKTIDDLAKEQDCSIRINKGDQGDIMDIYFLESRGYGANFFDSIAPFVESGSYIQINYEDEDIFRLVYRDGEIFKIRPTWQIDPE